MGALAAAVGAASGSGAIGSAMKLGAVATSARANRQDVDEKETGKKHGMANARNDALSARKA